VKWYDELEVEILKNKGLLPTNDFHLVKTSNE